MKKTILVSVLLLMMGVPSTFAGNGGGVSEKVLNTFSKEFTNAKEVKWEIGKKFVKATFSLHDQVMFAFYTDNGEQLGISRNIVSASLPIVLQNDLKNDLKGAWITELFEIVLAGETSYFVTVENADYTVVLTSIGLNGWEAYKKNQK